jgi:hypothetical protein
LFSGYAITNDDRKIPLHIRWCNWIDFLYRHGRRRTEGHPGIMYVLGDSFSVSEGNWRRHGSGWRWPQLSARASLRATHKATHHLEFEGCPTAKYTKSSKFHTCTISQCGRTRLGVTKARESASKSWGLCWAPSSTPGPAEQHSTFGFTVRRL